MTEREIITQNDLQSSWNINWTLISHYLVSSAVVAAAAAANWHLILIKVIVPFVEF